MTDEQDTAEALDDDVLRTDPGDFDDDPGHGAGFPPAEPVGIDHHGASEDPSADDSLAERVDREEPDPALDELRSIESGDLDD